MRLSRLFSSKGSENGGYVNCQVILQLAHRQTDALMAEVGNAGGKAGDSFPFVPVGAIITSNLSPWCRKGSVVYKHMLWEGLAL